MRDADRVELRLMHCDARRTSQLRCITDAPAGSLVRNTSSDVMALQGTTYTNFIHGRSHAVNLLRWWNTRFVERLPRARGRLAG
jgi:hypothetical protein